MKKTHLFHLLVVPAALGRGQKSLMSGDLPWSTTDIVVQVTYEPQHVISYNVAF